MSITMRPIAEGLFTDEQPPRLIGGRNLATGRIVFPLPAGGDFEPYPLKRHGVLWTFTVQRFRPKFPPYLGPEAFDPWAIGYVVLEGETIVEARLVEVPIEEISIGMKLELTQVPLDPAADQSVLIHAFRPARSVL